MVLNDGPIKKVEDLKGKVVATNAAGSAVDVAMRAMLRKHGLEDKRDYTVVEAPFPTMRAMLTEKKVDLVPAVLPFSLDPELRKVAHTLFTTADAVGVTQFSMWVARKPFIDKNRAALVDFMEDTLRIVRWYLDPANHKEVMEIAARITKQPPERFDWVFTAQGQLSRPQHEARSRGAAAQCRHHEGPRLRQGERRRQGACGPEHRRRGREKAEVKARTPRRDARPSLDPPHPEERGRRPSVSEDEAVTVGRRMGRGAIKIMSVERAAEKLKRVVDVAQGVGRLRTQAS